MTPPSDAMRHACPLPTEREGRRAPCPMHLPVQLSLISDDLPNAQDFAAWRDTRGGRLILQQIFRRTAYFGRRFLRTHQRVSMKLLWELQRDQMKAVRIRYRRIYGHPLPRSAGYALNNNFHAHVARFILQRRPDWTGLFEQRELGRPLSQSTAYLVGIRRTA